MERQFCRGCSRNTGGNGRVTGEKLLQAAEKKKKKNQRLSAAGGLPRGRQRYWYIEKP
jgi:hypothetical protein